jgi:hypothetical protein
MSETLEFASLSSLIDHVIGGAWGKEPGEGEVDVVAFGTKAFVGGVSVLDPSTGTARSVSRVQYEKRELLHGDIILEVSGGSETQPVGRTLLVDGDLPFVIPSSFMRLVRFNQDRIIPRYAQCALQWLYQTGVSAACQSNTTGIRNLNVPSFLQSVIPLPAVPEQRRIVDLIDALDQSIKAAERLADKTLYSELLTQTMNGHNQSPLSRALHQSQDTVSVDDDDSYRIVGVLRSGEGFIDRGMLDGDSMAYARLTRVKSDQLVYRKLTAWEGPISVTTESENGAFVSTEFPVFDIDCSILLPGLLRHMCRWSGLWKRMEGRLVGSVLRRKRLNPDQLLEVNVAMPSLPEQQLALDLLDAAWESQIESAAYADGLRTLRQEVLAAVVSGEHEIPLSYDVLLGVTA